MKKILYLTFLSFTCLWTSCSQSVPGDYDQMVAERDSLVKVIKVQQKLISRLQDSVRIYSYPADQRMNNINKLVKDNQFSSARKEIQDLRLAFPSSKEAEQCDALVNRIDQAEAKIKAEQDRIKALGFKAIKQKSTVEIGYNTITFANLNISGRFIFDYYGSRYFYRESDRGYKYVTANMKIKSTSTDPLLPQCAIYSISGDKMELERKFDTEFARWEDYGTYLGNYHDFKNDFAKTSTVNFKIGAEVREEVTKSAFAIVLMNMNGLTRETRDYPNPPVLYTGSMDYPSTLTLEDFTNGSYSIIKIYNLK